AMNSIEISQILPHTKTAAAVIAELETSLEGLTSEEARRRLEIYGANRLPDPVRPNVLKRFFLQFHNILIYVLLVSSAVTAALGHWTDSGVILAVVLVNAIVGFIQEGKAEKAMGAIQQM